MSDETTCQKTSNSVEDALRQEPQFGETEQKHQSRLYTVLAAHMFQRSKEKAPVTLRTPPAE